MKMPLQSQIKIMNLRNLHASMTRGIHFDGDGDGEVKKRRQTELHVVPFVGIQVEKKIYKEKIGK